MRVSPQHTSPYPYDDYDLGERFVDAELSAGERIGPRPRRTGRKVVLSLLLLLVLGLGGTWATLGPPDTWPVRDWTDWAAGQVAVVTAALERKAPVDRVSSAAVPAPNPDLNKPLALDTSPPMQVLPSAKIGTPVDQPNTASLTTGSLPPAADKAALEPLPPIHVDRSDPLQVRAEAVGLHPGLSRVLLARLSEADYRNAGIAIKTAVAETPDRAVHVWPSQRKPELAVFKVHFVPGAASDCRRYVVTVTKDGWITTALPMERCGAQAGKGRKQAG